MLADLPCDGVAEQAREVAVPIVMSRKIRCMRSPSRRALEPAVRTMCSCIASQAMRMPSRAMKFSSWSSAREKPAPSSTLRRHSSVHWSAALSMAACAVARRPTAVPNHRW